MTTHRFYGVYRGSVFDNRDPYDNNRLKIIVPQVLGKTPTEWAWGMDTASSKSAPPAIGQGVLVMFEGGDPIYPIWIGTFGKATNQDKKPYLAPLASSTSLSGITDLVPTHVSADGEVSLDLTSSVVALAHGVKAGFGSKGVVISSTPPPSPTAGDAWFDNTDGSLYIYYNDGNSSQWVQA